MFQKFEKEFEKLIESVTEFLGYSLVIIIVFIAVSCWVFASMVSDKETIDKMHDLIIGVSFLTFFMVQRSLNKFNRIIHVKLNELVKSHDNASNDLINLEKKSSKEIDKLAKELHDDDEKTST